MALFRQFIIFIILILIVVACTSTQTPEAMATATETVSEPDDSGEEAIETDVPDTPEARGQVLFRQMVIEVGFTCATCHYLTEARLIGPGLGNMTERFAGYDLDMTIEDYVIESITNPQDYIVESSPEYPANMMPTGYSEVLTEVQINDLVAYILSL